MSVKLFSTLYLLVSLSCTFVLAALSPGSNTYLPPDKGYNYEKPIIPFPTGPSIVPNERPSIREPTIRQPVSPYPPSNEPDHHHHVPGMPFDFQYAVNDIETSNDYFHKATSDGDVTRGEYRVQLPDGRTQVVRYTADWKTGYHAEVSYEGEAQYPNSPYSTGNDISSSNQGYHY